MILHNCFRACNVWFLLCISHILHHHWPCYQVGYFILMQAIKQSLCIKPTGLVMPICFKTKHVTLTQRGLQFHRLLSYWDFTYEEYKNYRPNIRIYSTIYSSECQFCGQKYLVDGEVRDWFEVIENQNFYSRFSSVS